MVNSVSLMKMKQSGFTMVELIVTMMIIGILAVSVLPRFTAVETYEARTFHDQAIAMMRYAQKLAVAQRRNVFFNANATSNTLCLSYALDAGCEGASPVLSPVSQSQYLLTAPSGVTLSATVQFSFSALGRASEAVALGVLGDDVTRSITVVQETGYVY